MIPTGLLGALSGVRWYVWALAVVVPWGLWQRHSARAVTADFETAKTVAAAARAASDAQAKAETARREAEKKGAIDEARRKSAAAAAALIAERASAERLRDRLGALEARACGRDPGAPDGSASAVEAGDLLAYVRGRVEEARRRTVEHADRASIAGETCERFVDSLTKPR